MQQWIDLLLAAGGLFNLATALTNLTTAVISHRTSRKQSNDGTQR
jgi:hypothetical protein